MKQARKENLNPQRSPPFYAWRRARSRYLEQIKTAILAARGDIALPKSALARPD